MTAADPDLDWRVVRVGSAIVAKTVRLIAADGVQLGVIETADALGVCCGGDVSFW